MKRYSELTREQAEKATDKALGKLLRAIVEGAVRFSDEMNGDDLQATLDAAMEKANEMRTPWFADVYILEARYNPGKGHVTGPDGKWPVEEHLRSMAEVDAEEAFYPEPEERVILGVA